MFSLFQDLIYYTNNFSMQRYNGAQMSRPRTMAQMRQKPQYQTIQPRTLTTRQFDRYTIEQDNEVLHNNAKNQESLKNYICIAIPKSISDFQFQSMHKKSNLYTRENMQQMNKKYRQIRSNQISPSVGLYDLQNDRRMLPLRTMSALNQYGETFLSNQIKPFVQSLKKFDRKTAASTSKGSRKQPKQQLWNKQYDNQQGILRAKSQRKHMSTNGKQVEKRKFVKSEKNPQDIFMPQKQSESGYVTHKFESKLRKKCLQDNLHVMATVLKKKIRILDKKQVMLYLNKIMTRNTNKKHNL